MCKEVYHAKEDYRENSARLKNHETEIKEEKDVEISAFYIESMEETLSNLEV